MAKKRKVSQDRIMEERFRSLRTNIEFSKVDNPVRVINVVSTLPGEGKSTVSTNLAKVFSDKYKNVLIIDCDLRNPKIHKKLHLSNSSGLSNLLTRYKAGDKVMSQPELQTIKSDSQTSNLYVITAGSPVPNPQEMLSSKRFKMLLDQARKEFSYIIIDCPPAQAVADSIPISRAADGTVFVVSSRDTDKKTAKEGLTELKRHGANIIGAVLNKAHVGKASINSYYYYGSSEK